MPSARPVERGCEMTADIDKREARALQRSPVISPRERPKPAAAPTEASDALPARQADPYAEQIHLEQLDTAYRNAPLGVLGAAVAGLVLIGMMGNVGDLSWPTVELWIATLAMPVSAHMVLYSFYWRARARTQVGRFWADAFVAAAAWDGLWWGCAMIWLAPASHREEQILTMSVAFIVAVGAIPAFGSYLPAFAAIFLTSTTLAMAWHIAQAGPLDHALAILTGVLIVVGVGLGWNANANFTRTLRLRFDKDALAEDLRRQKNVAEEASLSKSRFLAAASHDLRQPVHALSLFIGALSGHEMNAEMRRLIGHIEDSIHAMDGLFASLLDISKLDAGVVQPDPRVFSIGALLARVCRDYAGDAAAKGISLRLCPTSAFTRSDPVLLERVVRNLVANAVRYTDRGRVLVGCRSGHPLRLQIWDTGRGIPAAERERIFDEFYQIENPERDRAKGLGLGLAIVRRLASLLRHSLEMRSEIGRGSVFTLLLPAVESEVPHDAGSETLVATGFVSGLILVIDDEPMVLEAMRGLLTNWGAQVLAADSYAQMAEKIMTCPERPDLIISDYRLRGEENGIDVIRRLQSDYNDDDIPAILITGDTGSERLREAEESGFLALHKPVANGKLRATIGNLIGQRRGAGPK